MLGISNVYCEGEEDSVTLILYDVFVSVFKIKKKWKVCFILRIIHCIQRAVTTHYLATQLMIFLLLLQCLPYTWNELQLVHIVFFFVNIIMWFCLFHASTTDPGFLPRNIPEYDLAIKQVSYRLFLHIFNTLFYASFVFQN